MQSLDCCIWLFVTTKLFNKHMLKSLISVTYHWIGLLSTTIENLFPKFSNNYSVFFFYQYVSGVKNIWTRNKIQSREMSLLTVGTLFHAMLCSEWKSSLDMIAKRFIFYDMYTSWSAQLILIHKQQQKEKCRQLFIYIIWEVVTRNKVDIFPIKWYAQTFLY
jgi:hypothetical protein